MTIDGVIINDLKAYHDARGFLMEFFRLDEISALHNPAMGYISVTKPGMARGPHEHLTQTDYFCFPGAGSFLLVLWDNRKESPTFEKRMVIKTGDSSPKTVIVPPGVVHGYKCISNGDGFVINVPNKLYCGKDKRETVDEVRHEDDPDSPFVQDFKRITSTDEHTL